MAGAIGMVIALLLLPVAVLIGSGLIAAFLGYELQRDGEIRDAGSDLAELGD